MVVVVVADVSDAVAEVSMPPEQADRNSDATIGRINILGVFIIFVLSHFEAQFLRSSTVVLALIL